MKLGLRHFFALTLSFIIPAMTSAYVVNIGVSGEKLLWPDSKSVLTLKVDPSNSSGLSSIAVSHIVNESVSEWNAVSGKSIQMSAGSSNELFFSNNAVYFGGSSGVVGVTQVAYDEASGKIIEADIIMNDDYNFSSDDQDEFYLGNVLTHELGHFLGLSHSQVPRASMFYRLRRGQHVLAADDKGGARAIRSSNKGYFISGSVIGGQEKIPVLGAHVSAISLTNGEITAASLSDQSGDFTIYGLDSSDSYYLYVEPAKNISSLPDYYKDTKNNFCDSGTSYRGSFFQSCFSSGVGHPQLIQMSGKSQSVGYVTIRCQLDADPIYLTEKDSVFNFKFDQEPTGQLEATGSYVGFFTKTMLENNSPDTIAIDLPDLSLYPELQGRDIFLDVKFIFQDLYSVFQFNTETDGDSAALELPADNKSRFDEFSVPKLDTHLQFPLLSVGGSSQHQITITPQTMNQFLQESFTYVADYPYMPMTDDYFPAHDNGYKDDLVFYLAIATLRERHLDGSFTPVALPQQKTIFDNWQCPDASRTYSVSGSVSSAGNISSGASREKENMKLPLTCGSVDFTGGGDGGTGGNPPLTMIFLLGLTIALSHRLREAL